MNSKGFAQKTKTRSISIDTNSEVDYNVDANFIKHYKKHFIQKVLANDSSTSNKEMSIAQNKTQAK